VAEIPTDVVVAAAKASSPHFEDCDLGETWQNCQDCRLAYDRAHYAVHAAAVAIREAVRADVFREMGIHPDQVAERGAGRVDDPTTRPDDRGELLARVHAPVLREAAVEAAREGHHFVAGWLNGRARYIEAAGKVASSDA